MLKVALAAVLFWLSLSAVPQNPVIGVYTQIDEYDEPSTKEYLSTYISAAYVKYVWMSGAQVVPIYAFSNQSDIEVLLRKVNGVLFTGGAGEDEIHIDNRWVKNANFILQFAIAENKKGNVFPVWGTCLGLELLSYLTSGFDETILQPIRGSEHMLNVLKFEESSVLFDDLNANLRNKLTTGPGILYFNHEDGVKVSSYRNNRRMIDFWRVASTTTSPGGDTFVSTLESRDYPIFATQYHPEKNLYEWRIAACRTDEGAEISQVLSNKFVEYARANKNRFDSVEELNKLNIHNFNTTTTNLSYLRIFPFKEPRPDDWPYSRPSLLTQ